MAVSLPNHNTSVVVVAVAARHLSVGLSSVRPAITPIPIVEVADQVSCSLDEERVRHQVPSPPSGSDVTYPSLHCNPGLSTPIDGSESLVIWRDSDSVHPQEEEEFSQERDRRISFT